MPPELTGEGIEPGVARGLRAALELIEQLGGDRRGGVAAARRPRDLRLLRDRPGRGGANLARFDGVRYGRRAAESDTLLSSCTSRRATQGFGAEVKRRIMLGTYALSSGYYDAYYGSAQQVRTKIADDFRAAFATVDLIVTPTSPTVAFKLGERTDDPLAMYLSDVLHRADVARRHPRDLDPGRPRQRRACRSASSSPARRSARTGCSTRRTRSSRRSASTGARRRG